MIKRCLNKHNKNKKGAIELATNTMVIMIISLIGISLLIPFIRNMVKNPEAILEKELDKYLNLMMDIKCDNQEKICLYPDVINELGKEKVVTLRINDFSNQGSEAYYKLNYTYTTLDTGEETNNCVKVSLVPNNYETTIPVGKSVSLPIVIVPNGSESCNVNVHVYYSTNPEVGYNKYATKTIYVYR